jgi:hypothetical protein
MHRVSDRPAGTLVSQDAHRCASLVDRLVAQLEQQEAELLLQQEQQQLRLAQRSLGASDP